MALNTTILSGSGSPDNVANQTAATVPEYLSYTMLCIVLMSIPVVIVPALWAIVIIVKNKNYRLIIISSLSTFSLLMWILQ